MSDVGYATLQIIPGAKGFAKGLTNQIEGPLAQAGGSAGEKAGGSFGSSFAKVAAVGLAAGAAAVGAFAVKSAAKFAQVGGEVAKLSRYTGLTAEDASRLRFAGEESGIGVDAMTKSLGFLSKALSGKTLDKVGISFKDLHGKALPLNTDLLNIAKRFQTMPDGAQKTALAMKLFGKSGADLIPFLNKGADGIAALEKQSDKFGETLSGKDLAAVKASTQAHREFSAAMDGLQIQVGRYVLPIFTKFVTFTTSGLIPAITVVGNLASKYLGPAFDFAFGIIDRVTSRTLAFFTGRLLPGISAAIAEIVRILAPFAERAAAIFDRVRAVIDDKLTPALEQRLMPVLQKVANFVKGNFAPALAGIGAAGALGLATQLGGLAGSLGGVIQAIAILPNPITAAIVAIAALAAGFVYAYQHSTAFRAEVQRVVAGVKQAFELLFHGKFTGGPFAENSPFIKDVAKFRQFVLTKALPVLKQIADFVQGHLKQVLLGLGAVVLGLISPWALVGAAIVALYVKSSTFRAIVAGVADFLQTKVGPAIASFAHGVANVFGSLVGFVRDRWASISEAVTHVVNVIRDAITIGVNIISAIWRAWGDDLLHLAMEVWGFIRSTIENALTVVRGIIDFVLAVINGDWGKAWDGIKEILSGVWSEIGQIVGIAADLVKATIGGFLSLIGQVWSGAWDGMSGVVSSAWHQIVKFVVSLKDDVTGAASGLWDGLSSGLDTVVSFIQDQLQHVIDALNTVIGAANHLPGVNIPTIPDVTGAGKVAGGIAGASKAALAGAAALAGGPAPVAKFHKFADGGLVKHRPGGLFANIGEGRYDEAVVPLTAGPGSLAKAMAPFQSASGRQHAAGPQINLGGLVVHADRDTDGFKVGRDVLATVAKGLRTDPAFRAAIRDLVA